MIPLDDLRDQLCDLFKNQFPDAEFSISERRSALLEIRIFFAPEVFMESYFNAITGKKSFTLIESGRRIWGYDNYRYWHHHPAEDPESHVPCNEPSLKEIVNEVQTVLTRIEHSNKDRG